MGKRAFDGPFDGLEEKEKDSWESQPDVSVRATWGGKEKVGSGK